MYNTYETFYLLDYISILLSCKKLDNLLLQASPVLFSVGVQGIVPPGPPVPRPLLHIKVSQKSAR